MTIGLDGSEIPEVKTPAVAVSPPGALNLSLPKNADYNASMAALRGTIPATSMLRGFDQQPSSGLSVSMRPLTMQERQAGPGEPVLPSVEQMREHTVQTLAAPTSPENRTSGTSGAAMREQALETSGQTPRRGSAGRFVGAVGATALGLAGLFNMESRLPGAAQEITIGSQAGPTSSQRDNKTDWRVRIGGNKVGVSANIKF